MAGYLPRELVKVDEAVLETREAARVAANALRAAGVADREKWCNRAVATKVRDEEDVGAKGIKGVETSLWGDVNSAQWRGCCAGRVEILCRRLGRLGGFGWRWAL